MKNTTIPSTTLNTAHSVKGEQVSHSGQTDDLKTVYFTLAEGYIQNRIERRIKATLTESEVEP